MWQDVPPCPTTKGRSIHHTWPHHNMRVDQASSVVKQESTRICVAETEPAGEVACLSSASLPESIRTLRQQLKAFLNSSLLSPEELCEVELAAGEACTNAVKHGSPRGGLDEVRLRCTVNEHAVMVEVSDDGGGFDPESVLPPEPATLKDGGMGLFLMRALVDSVEFEFDAGTTVRLIKHRRRD